MNPVKQIGRYMLPLLNVVAIEQRQFSGWRKIFLWLGLSKGDYNVTLSNGRVIHFTEEEKSAYENEMAWHGLTSQVYGACRGMGLRT